MIEQLYDPDIYHHIWNNNDWEIMTKKYDLIKMKFSNESLRKIHYKNINPLKWWLFMILFAIYLILNSLQTFVIEDEYTHASVGILNCPIDI